MLSQQILVGIIFHRTSRLIFLKADNSYYISREIGGRTRRAPPVALLCLIIIIIIIIVLLVLVLVLLLLVVVVVVVVVVLLSLLVSSLLSLSGRGQRGRAPGRRPAAPNTRTPNIN